MRFLVSQHSPFNNNNLTLRKHASPPPHSHRGEPNISIGVQAEHHVGQQDSLGCACYAVTWLLWELCRFLQEERLTKEGDGDEFLQDCVVLQCNPARTWAFDRAAEAYPTPLAQFLSGFVAFLAILLQGGGRGGE